MVAFFNFRVCLVRALVLRATTHMPDVLYAIILPYSPARAPQDFPWIHSHRISRELEPLENPVHAVVTHEHVMNRCHASLGFVDGHVCQLYRNWLFV